MLTCCLVPMLPFFYPCVRNTTEPKLTVMTEKLEKFLINAFAFIVAFITQILIVKLVGLYVTEMPSVPLAVKFWIVGAVFITLLLTYNFVFEKVLKYLKKRLEKETPVGRILPPVGKEIPKKWWERDNNRSRVRDYQIKNQKTLKNASRKIKNSFNKNLPR